jgi:hypothetical protein
MAHNTQAIAPFANSLALFSPPGIFNMYDQDGSGFIDITELEEIMGKIGRNADQGVLPLALFSLV